jgi:hypothetical protein
MKRISSTWIVAALLVGSQALAGAKYGPNVVSLSLSFRTASGNALDARSSSDPYQAIGCSINQTLDPSTTWAQCAATNAANQTLTCFTQSPALIATARELMPSTNMGFTVDTAGNCATISAYNYSWTTLK